MDHDVYEECVFPQIQETVRKIKDEGSFETQYTSLLHYDIVKEDDVDRLSVAQIIDDPSIGMPQEQSAIACFIGSAIGDTLGNQTDQFPLDYNRRIVTSFVSLFDLRCPRALYTDDTSLALCLADSLLANGFEFNPVDFRHRIVLWWFEGYNNGKSEYFKTANAGKSVYDLSELKSTVREELWDEFSFGIGVTTYNAMIDFIQHPRKTRLKEFVGSQNSNGTIMRLASVPILFQDDVTRGMEVAAEQSYSTNDGDEAADCARLLTYVVARLIKEGVSKERTTKERIDTAMLSASSSIPFESSSVLALSQSQSETSFKAADRYNASIADRDWNWRSESFKYSQTRTDMCPGGIGGYSLDALAMALHLSYHSTSFFEAILKVANLGGDSDTVGCLTGMISGAVYGLSSDLLDAYKFIEPVEKQKTALRAYKLLHRRKI